MAVNLVTTDQRNSHVVHYGTPSREADAVAFGSLTNFEQFGCVHLVRNSVNHKYCVMKVLNKQDTLRMKQLDHTKNEREVLALVRNQPFFTQLYATYSDSVNLYFCLEFYPGGELFKLLREVGRFNQKTTAFYASEVLLAFEFLHERDIAYRDLKPENILIGADGHLRLCDFGFAKYIEDRSWTLCGTPEYLPPEIILGKGHDKSVDWWSFGVFLFEMLAGYAPFYGPRPIDIYDKILEGVGSVVFPNFFTPEAKNIIRRFLVSRSRRLGNTRGGIAEIKTHPFFASVNWIRVKNREIAPPAVPNLRGEGDRTNFDILEADQKFNLFQDFHRASGEVSEGQQPAEAGEGEEWTNMSLEETDAERKKFGEKTTTWDTRKGHSSGPTLHYDCSVFDDWPTTVYV